MNEETEKNYAFNSAINIKSVSKAFEARLVLKDINLAIDRGQSVCMCGVNGAGKSTLLRIISGLLQPDEGSVQLNGHNVSRFPEKTKPQLGVISHKSMVYPELTVFENLIFFGKLYGIKNNTVRVNELLEEMGLSSYRYDKAEILSRGLLQRLAIARALIHQPTILLADEPFTGLDVEACRYLTSVLTGFTNNGGTIVMTIHDISVGMQCCSRVVVLDKTNIIFDAMVSDLNAAEFSKDYLSYARSSK